MGRSRDSSPKRTKKEKPYIFGDISDPKQSVLTPLSLKEFIYREFNVDFDPCPFPMPPWDGLARDWGKSNFVNPPYNNVRAWMEKCVEQAAKGKTCILLVPGRVGTLYWSDVVYHTADELRFIQSAVVFSGYERRSPSYPTLIIYRPNFRAHGKFLPDKLVDYSQRGVITREIVAAATHESIAMGIIASQIEDDEKRTLMQELATWNTLALCFSDLLSDEKHKDLRTIYLPLLMEILKVEYEKFPGNFDCDLPETEERLMLFPLIHRYKKQLWERRREFIAASALPCASEGRDNSVLALDILKADWYASALSFCRAYFRSSLVEFARITRSNYQQCDENGDYRMHCIFP